MNFENTSNKMISRLLQNLTLPLIIFSIFSITFLFYNPVLFAQDQSDVANQKIVSYLKNNFTYRISSVAVDKNNITVTGNTHGSQADLYLCELRMYDEIKPVAGNFASITPINPSDKNFQIQLNRFTKFNDTGYDRIYSRWIITKKQGNQYFLQSFAHYADDIYGAANQYLPEEKPANKKGLAGFWGEGGINQDLQDLNIKNVTINFVLPSFVSLTPTSVSYEFNGQTYYFNPAVVSNFDKTIKLCTDNNIFISAILFIQQNISGQLKSIFVYSAANGGAQSMANITSLTGLNYYAAVISFLAERYTRTDKKFGRINNWIVHNEVDNGVYWTNAGNAKLEFYTELYDRSMRTVYYTVRQFDPAAKVFLSLSHFWASTDKPVFFPPKNLLTVFNFLSKHQGDYEWGIAYHPYPQDSFDPKSWDGKDATTDINSTKYITPKNIELIDQWLCTKNHLYNGLKVRTLLFSEQGVNSKSYSAGDLELQAAGLAYMWKKFERLPTLESFDYHRQTDNINEGGLKPGLWTVKAGTMVSPDKKKPAWYVFKYASTPSEDSAFAFALPDIGITNWSQAYNPLNDEAAPVNISFKISQKSVPLNNGDLYFNGEMHKAINGMATFYNVAVLPESRICVVEINGNVVFKSQPIMATKDQVISININ